MGIAFSAPNFTRASYGQSISSAPWKPGDLANQTTIIPYTIYLNQSMLSYPTASQYTGNFTALSGTAWPQDYTSSNLFAPQQPAAFTALQHEINQMLTNAALGKDPASGHYTIAANQGAYPSPGYLQDTATQVLSFVFPFYLTMVFGFVVRVRLLHFFRL